MLPQLLVCAKISVDDKISPQIDFLVPAVASLVLSENEHSEDACNSYTSKPYTIGMRTGKLNSRSPSARPCGRSCRLSGGHGGGCDCPDCLPACPSVCWRHGGGLLHRRLLIFLGTPPPLLTSYLHAPMYSCTTLPWHSQELRYLSPKASEPHEATFLWLWPK